MLFLLMLLIANLLARFSCTKYNKIRPLRKICRDGYQGIAALYAKTPSQRELRRKALSGQVVDSYSRIYKHPWFASWEENDDPENYSLVPDRSLCVVKYCTSYCAHKICELTGRKRLERKTRRRIDALDWDILLAENGFTKQVERPKSLHHYVGIDTVTLPWGEVVWLENTDSPHVGDKVLVSTYRDKAYIAEKVNIDDYVWVEID